MDNLRIILWGLFAALVFLTWQQWQLEHQSEVVIPAVAETPRATEPGPELPALSAADTPAAAALPQIDGISPAPAAAPVAPDVANIVVETDVLRAEISRVGGSLVDARLLDYPVSKDAPDIPVQILNAAPATLSVLETGLVDAAQSGPTHIAMLASGADRYTLADGQETLQVPLTWRSADGVEVTKTYTFRRGHYDVNLAYTINNKSGQEWRALDYMQLRRVHSPPERSMFNVDSYSFDGPVFYDAESYKKLDPDEFAEEPFTAAVIGGWLASIQHHFLSAVIPARESVYNYTGAYAGNVYTLRASGETLSVQPGATATVSTALFVGPKLQKQLNETAEGLALTVDYGKLTILAQPLFWILQQVHNLAGNWGWSIILVTFMIKAAFYKLTEASGRSMAKMRKLQPRLKSLQERYKDDRQQLSQKMMELYKTEKVNPAAGCLPMLIQIPFFISFYWVLLESVEMRQAPFALWITDLSTRDPYFVLPLLMGVAMFVQQKLNPAPPDPVQAKVMQILPIMFTGFFAFFPSGLVLYWLTNSVLSVLQQWNINRKMKVD